MNGCPEIEEEVEEILKTAFENLEFETGKDIIKEESKPSLGELADVLLKKPVSSIIHQPTHLTMV